MKTPTNLSELTSSLQEDINLEDLGISKHFASGETIVSEDAPVRSIPIVTKGSVKVIQSDDTYREMGTAREVILRLLKKCRLRVS